MFYSQKCCLKGVLMFRLRLALLSIIFLLFLVSCTANNTTSQQAVTVLQPFSNSTISGYVGFEQLENELKITGRLKDCEPYQELFILIYEFGDLSSSSGRFLGNVYNSKEAENPFFIAVKADARGSVMFKETTSLYSLKRKKKSIIGRSVVVALPNVLELTDRGFTAFKASGVIGYKFIKPDS